MKDFQIYVGLKLEINAAVYNFFFIYQIISTLSSALIGYSFLYYLRIVGVYDFQRGVKNFLFGFCSQDSKKSFV